MGYQHSEYEVVVKVRRLAQQIHNLLSYVLNNNININIKI